MPVSVIFIMASQLMVKMPFDLMGPISRSFAAGLPV